jgi:hypothetical protein
MQECKNALVDSSIIGMMKSANRCFPAEDEFGDFELDWKIGEAGNSGVFYRGTEEYEHIYWSAPEYQLLDDVKAAERWSPDWEAKVMASKFADWPNFGRAKRGHIALQGDHEGSLGFKNIRIREVH